MADAEAEYLKKLADIPRSNDYNGIGRAKVTPLREKSRGGVRVEP